MAVPLKIRLAAIKDYEDEVGSLDEVARRHSVGRASLARWRARKREGDEVAARKPPGGEPLLDDADRAVLLHLAHKHPDRSMTALQDPLEAATGKRPSAATMARTLRMMGHRLRPSRAGSSTSADEKK